MPTAWIVAPQVVCTTVTGTREMSTFIPKLIHSLAAL